MCPVTGVSVFLGKALAITVPGLALVGRFLWQGAMCGSNPFNGRTIP
jgi:hypothetical protein